jgi:serine/threonine protein kinase
MPPKPRDLISRLCTVDTSSRLGNIQGGAKTVKSHPWFEDVNWEDVYFRRKQGPIVPHLKGPTDTRNFDEYEPEPEGKEKYGEDMRRKYENAFADF